MATDSGACATVRLNPVRAGDAALLVTAGAAGRTTFTAPARALHAQIA
ncbi:hypothetical protein [Streptomyces sp. NPDC002403]